MPYIQTLGVTFALCSYCYAMLVDVDWFERIHDRCESYYLMVNLENSVFAQGDPGGPV